MFQGFKFKTVAVSDVSVRVRHGGDGPPLLFLHGETHVTLEWWRAAAEFAKSYSVICVSVRSNWPVHESAPEVATLADTLIRVMSELGHERFAVSGHDSSGLVALEIAHTHPAVAREVFLLDSPMMASEFEQVGVWSQAGLRPTTDNSDALRTHALSLRTHAWIGGRLDTREMPFNEAGTSLGAPEKRKERQEVPSPGVLSSALSIATERPASLLWSIGAKGLADTHSESLRQALSRPLDVFTPTLEVCEVSEADEERELLDWLARN